MRARRAPERRIARHHERHDSCDTAGMTTATPDILALRGTIAELLSAIVAEERAQAGRIALALPRHRQSAENQRDRYARISRR